MNYIECKIIAQELNALISDAKLQKVKENENGDFYLSFYKAGANFNVLLTVNPPYPRIHLTQKNAPKSHARNFTMYLRKHVVGKNVKRIISYEGERIIEIDFHGLKLVAEIFPRGGNVYVLHEDYSVNYSLVPVDFDVYEPPEDHEPPDIKPPDVPKDKLYNEVLGEKYAEKIENEEFEKLKSRAVKMLIKEQKRTCKKIVAVEKDLEKSENAHIYQNYADLIKTYFYDIKRGMTEYQCTNHETGEKIIIPLDEKLTPEENMKAYYKKAKKIKQGREYVKSNVKRAQEQGKTVLSFLERAKQSENLEQIKTVLDDMQKNKYLKRVAGNVLMKKGKSKEKEQTPFRKFTTETGHEIFIGRSDEENDKLTFTFANGRDFWFHVADYAGSHVVVPVKSNDEELDNAILSDAAQLAVHYSKAKGMAADVHFTRRKFVTKSKGMPKGMVNVSKFKTLFVKYDTERIRDLMEMNR